MTTHDAPNTETMIDELTAMQDARNQHHFRETLRSIVRLAYAEGIMAARDVEETVMVPMGRLH